jgi:hypothetical protein
MDATRTRPWLAEAATPRRRLRFDQDHVSGHVEWAIDAAILMVAVLVGVLLVRELRFAPWAFDSATTTAASTDVPREAVSVPTLVLAAGREVYVGEARDAAVASLGSLTLLRRTEEPGPLGAREVRSYQGVTLVLEPFERAGNLRVAAIYLQ